MNQNRKFALGGGGYCLYAPRFPRYQDQPGFADEVLIFNAILPQLFVLSLVENRVPLTLSCRGIESANGKATLTFQEPGGLEVIEHRFVTTDDRFVSELQFHNGAKADREIAVMMWTLTDVEGEPVSQESDSFRVRRQFKYHDFPPVPAEIVWSSPDSKGARCLVPYFCEGGSDRPDYEETPWFDMAQLPTPRAKRPMEKPSPIQPGSRVYAGLFRPVALKAGGKATHRFEANVIFRGKNVNYRPRRPDPKDENGYAAFRERVPRFSCDSKPLERVVQHRFELLNLLRVPHGAGLFSSPAVCEGNGLFHQPVAFSAPAIMREARWLRDPTLGRGILKLFFENVQHNGQVPGRVYMAGLEGADFYHADWGGGFEALDAIHGDRATKKAVLMAMQRYVKWLANNRDPEGSGLTDVVNHFEAGQEFSRRYTVIDKEADKAEIFAEQFRLKGIDASVFRYRLVKYLARVADEIQEKAMANRFVAEAEVIQETVRKRMWDDKAGIFMDMDPKTRRRTGVKAAVGFYPMCTDIPTSDMVEKMLDTLSDRKEFWTRYPVPSLALSDPYYDADGRWKGTRRNCPWNGRVWPMINCHVLDGLTYWAERGNKKAQRLLGELFKRTVAMLSGEAEGTGLPNAHEHYHPETGLPSRYRGIDLYLHGFVLDHVFRVACGVAVRFGEIQDDPVVSDTIDFKLQGMPLGNKQFDVERKNGKLRIAPA
jgi:hypothetical protein